MSNSNDNNSHFKTNENAHEENENSEDSTRLKYCSISFTSTSSDPYTRLVDTLGENSTEDETVEHNKNDEKGCCCTTLLNGLAYPFVFFFTLLVSCLHSLRSCCHTCSSTIARLWYEYGNALKCFFLAALCIFTFIILFFVYMVPNINQFDE